MATRVTDMPYYNLYKLTPSTYPWNPSVPFCLVYGPPQAAWKLEKTWGKTGYLQRNLASWPGAPTVQLEPFFQSVSGPMVTGRMASQSWFW